MADVLRLVTVDTVGRARLVLDLNATLDGVTRLRDTFRVTPGNRHDDTAATVAASFAAGGDTAADTAGRLEDLLELADRLTAGEGALLLEWGPDGLDRRVYWRLRGRATVAVNYSARRFAGSRSAVLEVTWPADPLAEGLPLDLVEDFRPPPDDPRGIVNRIANPSFVAGLTGWQAYAGATVGTAYGQTAVSITGNGTTADAGIVTPTVNRLAVTPGKPITGVAVPRAPATTARYVAVYFAWYDAAGVFLSTTFGPQVAELAGVPAVLTATPPAGAASVAVYAAFRTGSAAVIPSGEVHYFDGIMVIDGDELVDYFDGDAPLGRWTGAPHASPSALIVEDPLADYTVDAGPFIVRHGTVLAERGLAPRGADCRLRHTGRGYGLPDAAAWATDARTPTQGIQAGVYWYIMAGRTTSPDATRVIEARVGDNGSGISFVRLVAGAIGAEVQLATVNIAALGAGARAAVRLVIAGTMARAEYWTAPPHYGGKPAAVTAWVDVAAYLGDGGHGYYRIISGEATPAVATTRILTLLEEPYTYADVKTPDELILNGVPGSAPARADVRIGQRPTGSLTANFGLLGWRRRRRRGLEPSLPHGEGAYGWFSTSVGGHLAAGGSVADSATGGVDPAEGYRIITTTATANTGGEFRLWDRFHRGRTYTVEFYARVVSGTWQALAAIAGGAAIAGATVTPVGAALARYRFAFTAADDFTGLELVFRGPAAAAGVMHVARLRTWEGTDQDAPMEPGHAIGKGAYPAFGFLPLEAWPFASLYPSKLIADADSPTGRAFRVDAGDSPTFSWLLDPDALASDTDDVPLDFEVYLLAKSTYVGAAIGPGKIAARLYSQGSDTVMDVRNYTREHGDTPKPLTAPTHATGGSFRLAAWRLGTIPLERDVDRTGRLWLRLELDAYSTGVTTGALDVYGLVLASAGRRMSSPTGKLADAAYPAALYTWADRSEGKVLAGDGTGYRIAKDTGGLDRVSGLGGAALELEPGDNELLAWFHVSIPDQPDGAQGLNAGSVTLDNVHVRVTPRYRLMRPT